MAMMLQGKVPIRGLPGTSGTSGKSAFQSAQEGGYTGTEQDFYADLAAVSELVNGVTAAKELADSI